VPEPGAVDRACEDGVVVEDQNGAQ
jgi:hypothetical protein